MARRSAEVFGKTYAQGARLPSAWGEEDVSPLRNEVTVVPAGELVHHGAGGWMHGDILDQALAHDIDPAPIAQGLSILGTGPHVP
jgi:hypothetical protein